MTRLRASGGRGAAQSEFAHRFLLPKLRWGRAVALPPRLLCLPVRPRLRQDLYFCTSTAGN